ncbi:hypothetical protein [Capillimicrobium parvum]|uniref:Uncharacterized protein n=1 Tax=Capillimicrobium parvum TaxID=2884022 RepID=A0A9E6XYA8_9ACTN|nr:hypothetical protein [Capillimicrobium parvum]UGS36097.1 hypothetical protein DSM104329_02495 [Capillimicrobium parvum]
MIATVFAFERPDGSWGAVNDDTGRLIGTQIGFLAGVFMARLKVRGADVHPVQVTPAQMADLLLSAGYGSDQAAHRFALIEGQAEDVTDALRWAIDLADLVPLAEVQEPSCQH